MTDEPATPDTTTTGHADPSARPGESELRRLRRLVREQLAGAVGEDRLDITLANGMLTVFGCPRCPAGGPYASA